MKWDKEEVDGHNYEKSHNSHLHMYLVGWGTHEIEYVLDIDHLFHPVQLL